MSRDLILGTAGHIDHGKTSLVKALTGTDCDRLPEEKARGITIDIGFAALDLGEYRLGIVDVPGHERFIKNMLAGATGIDLALLVIAADDLIMPQTREHLEILKLLGLRRGVIALTKCDLMPDTDVRDVATLDIRELVAGSFLANAPLIHTSTHTGEGVSELKAALAAACRDLAMTDTQRPFRLAIDRSFVVQGHGTVVTGSVTSGSMRVGDELEWLPRGERVRVRALHHHDEPVDEVHRGMRAAINLAGVDHHDVVRGQELAEPGYLLASKCMTVSVKASADVRRPLKHRNNVRLHIGTAEVMAVLSLLDCDVLNPGEWGLGQLFLEESAMAVWGQPFVLRESSAATTLGGGRVLQPVAHKIRRRDEDMLTRLNRLSGEDVANRAEAVARNHGINGVSDRDLVCEAGIAPADVTSALAALRKRGVLIDVAGRLMHANSIGELQDRVLDVLAKMHQEQPLVSAHERSKVLAKLDYLNDEPMVTAAIDQLIANRGIIATDKRIARSDFKPRLSINLQRLLEKIVAAHAARPFQPPDPASFANLAGGNTKSLGDVFDVAVAEGSLVKVTDGIFLHAAAESSMRRQVSDKLKAGGPGLTVADIRDMLGTTRKYAVPLCEYLDRVGLTRRQGDLRVLKQELAPADE
jgi:selenocysteine-specific elongation factor